MEKTLCIGKKSILKEIVDLFDGSAEIDVLLNENLCSLLTKLAGSMQQAISAENKRRVQHLIQAFKKIN